MNVFELDADVVGRYEAFTRSSTFIRSVDINTEVDAIYPSANFWRFRRLVKIAATL